MNSTMPKAHYHMIRLLYAAYRLDLLAYKTYSNAGISLWRRQ